MPSTLVRAHPMFAAFSDPLIAVRVVEQGREVGVAADDDAPATTTIAAVGSAHGSAPFPAERGAARSTSAALYSDYYAVDEHYCLMGEIWVRRNRSGVLKRGANSVPAPSREPLDVANPTSGHNVSESTTVTVGRKKERRYGSSRQLAGMLSAPCFGFVDASPRASIMTLQQPFAATGGTASNHPERSDQ